MPATRRKTAAAGVALALALVTTDDEGAKGFGYADEISIVIGPMLPGVAGGFLTAPAVS